MYLLTERLLLLREWKDEDIEPMARMHNDPGVMRYLSTVVDGTATWINHQRDHFEKHGYGLWVLERSDATGCVGYCGLINVDYRAHFTPAVEISWMLDPDYWGRGYVTEAAAAVLAFGFQNLKLNQIVANAAVGNVSSRRVMERIGMSHDPKDDFDHPQKAVDSPLRRQVLYRLTRQEWHRKL